MSYDQWKTASPYDDEPDVVEEAERFLKETQGIPDLCVELERENDPDLQHAQRLLFARTIIEALLQEI